ncbi:MAG: hypothetical protein CBC25_03395 [Pelagibacteraceae bacterium TMED65]|nr:hypothetical protein [Rickettsiales bacterium]OUU52257.1 MAG: hypothetical protein CBC25_03395 [Pelagibacteraceae bacterium TMED65]|tara:strand:- start:1246 stop:2343 length:1098 start_codon:yes stop_codon:yes gene_type:complete
MIIILGAGIIGLFSAYNLLKVGKKIKIFDSKSIKANSTNASVGMLAPAIESKPQELKLYNLMKESKDIWNKLNDDKKLSRAIGLKSNNSLMIALNHDDEERLKFKKVYFEKIGYDCQFLNSEDTLKLEPFLNSNVKSSLLCANQDQVNPEKLKKFLISEIKKMGGEIVYGEKIKKISLQDNQLLSVNGIDINFEKIVISCGSWSNEIISNSFGLKLPLVPLKGVSILVNSIYDKLNHNLWFRNIYAAPRDDGIIAIGATEDEKGFDSSIKLDELHYLTKSIWESFPKLEDLNLREIRVGLRPAVIDGNPVLGILPKVSSKIICAFGHYRHGVLLAPITANIVTEYVLDKKIPEKYKFFSPSRFNL